MIEQRETSNLQSKDTFEQSNLYALTFEALSPIESNLLELARPESNTSQSRKRAIISLVASAIALVDIAILFDDQADPLHKADPLHHANLDTRIGIHDTDVVRSRGEGGYDDAVPSVSGCLPHSNFSPKKYENIGRKIHNMLSLLSKVQLSEEEWDTSYELHVKNRKSKNPLSDRRVRF